MTDDEIDPDTESRLYSMIYHQPLAEHFDGIFASSSYSLDDKTDTKLCKTKITPAHSTGFNYTSKVIALTKTEKPADFRAKIRKSNWFAPLSSSSESSKCPSISSDLSSSVQLLEQDSGVELSSLRENLKITSNLNISPSTSCSNLSADLPENALEILSLEEIQSRLPSDPELWKICEEDFWADTINLSSRGRYYARKIRCKRCNEEGHKVSECPEKKTKLCFICGRHGHVGFKCPQKSCVLCFQTSSHFTDGCRFRKVMIDRINCSRCLNIGHKTVDCHENWRQFHLTACTDLDFRRLKKAPKTKMKPSKKSCYNCGAHGHLGHECLRSTNFNGKLIAFRPNIRKYDTANQLHNLHNSNVVNANDVMRLPGALERKFEHFKNPEEYMWKKVRFSGNETTHNNTQNFSSIKQKKKQQSRSESTKMDRNWTKLMGEKQVRKLTKKHQPLTKNLSKKLKRKFEATENLKLVQSAKFRPKKRPKRAEKQFLQFKRGEKRANNGKSDDSVAFIKKKKARGEFEHDSVAFIKKKKARGEFEPGRFGGKGHFTWDFDNESRKMHDKACAWFC